MLKVFRSRKMAAILVLGFSSGLPLYLTSRTLQAWMTVTGVNLTAIGFFSLVSLPYSLKFLWSPIIDRFEFSFLGRRKGWLIVTQVALAVAIAAMAFQRPAQALQLLALNTLAIAFLSATQDIVVDAYSTDICGPSETAPLPGRKSGLSYSDDRYRRRRSGHGGCLSWPATYALLGLVMFVLSLASSRIPEPVLRDAAPASLREAVQLPLSDFFKRMGRSRGLSILAFILLYRLGDAMIDRHDDPVSA